MKPLSAVLGEFAAALTHADLPEHVTADVRRHLLDTVGVCCASLSLPIALQTAAVARRWGGPPEARMIGTTERAPAPTAAFVNGVLAHAQDFDDTHLPSVLHPSASILPTALAVAEAEGRSTRELIVAAVAGYEVTIRTGMAAYDRDGGSSLFFERGWHATSICGALGSAVTAAKLMGLDAATSTHALGIATSMGSGLLEANRVGGSVKQLHCGWAAHSGVIAAQLAAAGVTAAPTALEGRFGFFQAYCGRHDPAVITEALGARWSTDRLFFKPYPANHFLHAAIDGALALRRRVTPDEVASVDLGLPTAVLRSIAEPRESKLRPESGYHARFSAPFAVAAAFHGGGGLGLDLDDFSDERARDPRLLAFAERVICRGDAACDAIFPGQLPAIVKVTTRDGRVLEEQVLFTRGGPERPLGNDELLTKFNGTTRATLSPTDRERIAAALLSREEQPVRDLPWPVAGRDVFPGKEAVER